MGKLAARGFVSPAFLRGRCLPYAAPQLRLTELPLHGLIRIQAGTAELTDVSHRLAEVTGLAAPDAERMTGDTERSLVWSAPGEWLYRCPLSEESDRLDALRRAFAGRFVTLTLMSDSRVSFQVSGVHARALLAKGCSIDLHRDALPPRAAVTTRFASLPAMLIHPQPDEFVVYFDVSLTAYVVEWLLDSAQEFLPPP